MKLIKFFLKLLVFFVIVIVFLNVFGGHKNSSPAHTKNNVATSSAHTTASRSPSSPADIKNGVTPPTSAKVTPQASSNLKIKFGTYFAPRNFPASILELRDKEIEEYFTDLREVGDHSSQLVRWDEPELEGHMKEIVKRIKAHGFKVHLHLDPLTGWSHATPAPPKSLGKTSFGDPEVRNAFIQKLLEFAALKPDVLGMGTEVNLMLHEGHTKEFQNYVSLVKEAYKAIKAQYPSQKLAVSFSWDVMRSDNTYSALKEFEGATDIYAFTSYPNILTVPGGNPLPNNFYDDIRNYLPTERIAISEIGWYSGVNSSEESQTAFYKAFPGMLARVYPEFVTQFVTYDYPKGVTSDERFRTLGVRHENGTPKKAWDVIHNYAK